MVGGHFDSTKEAEVALGTYCGLGLLFATGRLALVAVTGDPGLDTAVAMFVTLLVGSVIVSLFPGEEASAVVLTLEQTKEHHQARVRRERRANE